MNFIKQEIEIKSAKRGTLKIPAFVAEGVGLAYNRPLSTVIDGGLSDSDWVVTHVASGLQVTNLYFKTQKAAKAAIEAGAGLVDWQRPAEEIGPTGCVWQFREKAQHLAR